MKTNQYKRSFLNKRDKNKVEKNMSRIPGTNLEFMSLGFQEGEIRLVHKK